MTEEQQQPQEEAQDQAEQTPAEEAAPASSKRGSTRAAKAGAKAPRARKAPATAKAAAEPAEAAAPESEPQEAAPPAETVADEAPARPSRRARPAAPQVQLAKPRLEVRYLDEIRAALIREFGYASSMQAPRPSKVVVNIGLGEALTNAKALETAPEQLGAITGQHPVITKARRSIAGFKVREGQSIGAMVTLRGRRMYEFLDRLINVALPRIRDFRGVSRTAFDGKGNYSLGLREQGIFPELEYGSIDRARGLQVTITTTAINDREGFRLLELMGLPFAREGQTR